MLERLKTQYTLLFEIFWTSSYSCAKPCIIVLNYLLLKHLVNIASNLGYGFPDKKYMFWVKAITISVT